MGRKRKEELEDDEPIELPEMSALEADLDALEKEIEGLFSESEAKT